jgi:tetratricopeptide (TPR) repeat protein
MALSTALPPTPAAHLQAAQLFAQAGDYTGSLTQYRDALRLEPTNASALIGAGEAAYHAGNYTAAQHYLQAALNLNPEDGNVRQLLVITELVLRTNPFRSHISDAERNRRITTAFTQSEGRLIACAQRTGINLSTIPSKLLPQAPASPNQPSQNHPSTSPASQLSTLQSRWLATKPSLVRLNSPAETDLPDEIMDLVFQIEQQTASTCGPPQGLDQALLLISQKREAAIQ